MTVTFESLGLAGLSADEKLDVVGQLWADLAAAALGGFLSAADRAELTRRAADATLKRIGG